MGNLEREMLLGYLMNALEDDEIAHVERELLRQPNLRTELAMLQKELSPLTSLYDSVDPPRHLAKRTCDKIWTHVDREEHFGHFFDTTTKSEPIISMTIPCAENVAEHLIPKRSSVLEEILAVSPQSSSPTSTNHSEHKRLVRRTPRSGYSNNHSTTSDLMPVSENPVNSSKSTKKGRWFDIITPVAVGILIAIIAFPAINYAKNRTERYFAWSTIHKINKSVDHYTQIQSGGNGEEMLVEQQPSLPVNLAQSGWQELKPTQLPALLVGDTVFDSVPIESYPNLLKSVSMNSTTNTVKAAPSQGKDIILGQSRDVSISDVMPLDPREFTDQTLISNVDHVIPIMGGSTLQTAYGQNILFQNGRIFVRILPVFAPNK